MKFQFVASVGQKREKFAKELTELAAVIDRDFGGFITRSSNAKLEVTIVTEKIRSADDLTPLAAWLMDFCKITMQDILDGLKIEDRDSFLRTNYLASKFTVIWSDREEGWSHSRPSCPDDAYTVASSLGSFRS